MKLSRTTSLLSFFLTLLIFACVGMASYIPHSGLPAVPSPTAAPTVLSAQTNANEVYLPVKRTKSAGCVTQGILPDPACTPGGVFPTVTKEEICKKGYAGSVRDVSQATKKKVYDSYGVTSRVTGEYEVDHLISLQLGGSNDIANLWPEPADDESGFRQKDSVENFLHQQVCNGEMSLFEAQEIIATDWLNVFHQMRD